MFKFFISAFIYLLCYLIVEPVLFASSFEIRDDFMDQIKDLDQENQKNIIETVNKNKITLKKNKKNIIINNPNTQNNDDVKKPSTDIINIDITNKTSTTDTSNNLYNEILNNGKSLNDNTPSNDPHMSFAIDNKSCIVPINKNKKIILIDTPNENISNDEIQIEKELFQNPPIKEPSNLDNEEGNKKISKENNTENITKKDKINDIKIDPRIGIDPKTKKNKEKKKEKNEPLISKTKNTNSTTNNATTSENQFTIPDDQTVSFIEKRGNDNINTQNISDNSDSNDITNANNLNAGKKYPEIIRRPVYDYRTTILPPAINKKEYSENNDHLPKVFYNDEYSALLFVAVSKDKISDIKAILQKNADINAKDSRNGYTPLMYAAKGGYINSIRYLITKGANVDLQAFDGKTALHFAIINKNMKIAKVLLSADANISAVDSTGRKAYDYLDEKTKTNILLDLVKNYQDYNKALIDFTKIGSVDSVEYILKKNVNINYKNIKYPNDTALIIGVRMNNIEMVQFLIARGADYNMKNTIGETALSIAIQNHNIDMINTIRTISIRKDLEKSMLQEENNNGMVSINNN